MSAISELLGKSKGNKALLFATIVGIIFLALVIGLLGGAILICGLNLMGAGISYTLKTMIGGAIVISCFRNIGSGSAK